MSKRSDLQWEEATMMTLARYPGSTASELVQCVQQSAQRGAVSLAADIAPGSEELAEAAREVVRRQLEGADLQVRRALGRLNEEGKVRMARVRRARSRGRPSFDVTYYVADASMVARPFPFRGD